MTWHNIWGYWLLTTSNKASAKTFNFQIFCVESFLIISISPFWWREWLFWDLLGTNFCDLPETPCAIFNPFVPFVDPCNNRLLAGLPDLYLQAVSVGQWPVSDDWSIFDITWLTPWATSSPTPWFRAAQCSGPHKLTEYNKELWNISNLSELCRMRRREEVPGVRPPNSGSWHGCCIHCWPGPRRWVEGGLVGSKMRQESLVLLLQTENSKFQRWGRGNLGNIRKKTVFLLGCVP